ncbi:hypothetical protein KGF56_000120 [Candida oxycetoniae]|uniref:Uncharacterized protein n=1 Tax=Candida oxycetoniae TaxID=497107 RepID=A0AAI9T1R2_9ASCO|nr:uncharacterized protein KGF56_000120 [Candida oxycetoniae]KAI3407032.2 hypothetical protein KGF56_000120 [Candida oxycetoniae]
MQVQSLLTVSALAAIVSAAFENVTVTTEVTVTGYTTYCPEPTTITLTVCDAKECTASELVVDEPKTITVTEECIVPVSYTTEEYTVTETVTCQKCAEATQEAAEASKAPEAPKAPEEPASVAPAAEEPASAAPAAEEPAIVAPAAEEPASVAPIEQASSNSTVNGEVTPFESSGVKNAIGLAGALFAIAVALL